MPKMEPQLQVLLGFREDPGLRFGADRLGKRGMRSMFFASLTAAAFLVGVSCERHDWEETQQLHKPHGGHDGHGEEAGHGDAGGHKEGKAGEGAEH